MNSPTIYDLLVVGGGPAGYAAAIYGAKNHLKVGLVEKDKLGGTCLNRGCIPTKTYCVSAEILFKIKESNNFSVKIGSSAPFVDFPSLFGRKESIVNKQVEGIKQLIKGNKIDYFEGEAIIESDSNLKININNSSENINVKFKNLIISTGSEPADIKGIAIDHINILDSTDILSLKRLPSSLLIIGGGVIGVEIAMIMSAFGVKVYLSEILKRIIATEDIMASRIIQNRLKMIGVDVNTDVKIDNIEILDGGVNLSLSNGKRFFVEKVLVAAGRRPVVKISDTLKSLLLNEKGFVCVDEYLRTKINNVYAAGDVIGGIMLAHKAHYDGEIAVDNILGKNHKVDYSAVPAVVYTYPEIASVGISEERAKEQGIEIKTGRFFVASNGMAMAKNATEGFVKIIAEKGSGRIIGGTVVSESASEMITALTLAIKEKVVVESIRDLIWPHPTISESMGEAIRDVEGMAIHKLTI